MRYKGSKIIDNEEWHYFLTGDGCSEKCKAFKGVYRENPSSGERIFLKGKELTKEELEEELK